MPRRPGLAPGDALGDDDISGLERKDVGRLVLAAVFLVEEAHTRVGHDGNRDVAAGAGRRDPDQPGRQTGRADGPAAIIADGDAEPRRITGIHRTLRTP